MYIILYYPRDPDRIQHKFQVFFSKWVLTLFVVSKCTLKKGGGGIQKPFPRAILL